MFCFPAAAVPSRTVPRVGWVLRLFELFVGAAVGGGRGGAGGSSVVAESLGDRKHLMLREAGLQNHDGKVFMRWSGLVWRS